MTTERFNGIKTNTTLLSDTEVLGLMEHTAGRLHRAGEEMGRLTGMAIDRGLFPVQNIVSIEQAREVYGPDVPFDGIA